MNIWRRLPETRLLALGFPLHLVWEGAQLPLYTLWREAEWGYILYSMMHCTLSDMLILLVCYEAVALLNRNRYWLDGAILWNGLALTILGVGYAVYSEINSVYLEKTWAYTEMMPLVPVIGVGISPLLQWAIIPPLMLWLLRRQAARQ
jgi:arginine exporter protein ArgO